MKLPLLSGFLMVMLLGCSNRIEQVSSDSKPQWLCDASPTTGEWDCRRLASNDVPPLPVASVVEQTYQQSPPETIQRAFPEQTGAEQRPQLTVPPPTQKIAESAQPAAPTIPTQAEDTPPTTGYVVQLAALSNRPAVTRFIDQQQLSQESLTWHRTYSQGRHWYVVTTEPINSHVQALAKAGRLEGNHPGLATWVRSLHSLQQVISN